MGNAVKYFLSLILLSAFVPSVRASDIPSELVSQVYGSVVLLYSQNESGDMKMRCTATAYRTLADVDNAKKVKPEAIRTGYRFVTAAHCVSGDTDAEQARGKYFVTLDTAGAKTFIPATLVRTGDKKKGDDFSIFEVVTDSKIPVIPLGKSDSVSLGDSVINVAGPDGLGKQFFAGYVSEKHLDRPPLNAGDVQWTDVMLVSIGGGPGSSGSAIVSVSQKAIVGFLVGSENASQVGFIVVPVDKFIAFEKAVDAGTYKKEKASSELTEVDVVYLKGETQAFSLGNMRSTSPRRKSFRNFLGATPDA